MPGYVNEALTRFQHEMRKLNDQPHKHAVPVFGATIQYTKPEDTSPLLNEEDKKYVQKVTGTFLYYARAVDPTMLVALSAIASSQSSPTATRLGKVK